MDRTTCAKIVFAECEGWLPAPGSPDGVGLARLELAKAVWASGDGAGFRYARDPGDYSDPNWLACVQAANEADIIGHPPQAVWIATGNPADDPAAVATEPWLRNVQKPGEAGPFLEMASSTEPRKLWVFAPPAIASRRYPQRADDKQLPVWAKVPTIRGRALLLFIALVLGLIGVGYWSYGLGSNLAFGNTTPWRTPITHAVEKAGLSDYLTSEQIELVVRTAAPWDASWQNKPGARRERFEQLLRAELQAIPADVLNDAKKIELLKNLTVALKDEVPSRISINLVAPWIIGSALVLAMLMTIGSQLKGTVVGVLVGSRNRLSLSRFQLYMWTILVATLFYCTSLMLVGADPGVHKLPTYPYEIWALLGIAIGTVPVSGLLLKPKSEQEPSEAALQHANIDGHKGLLESRASSDRWSLLDLFIGEEVGNANEVDPSRFQSFLLTIILSVVFVGWCGSIFWSLVPQTDWSTWADEHAIPHLGETFIGLLAVSHATYLGFKAVGRTDTAKSITTKVV